MSLNENTIKYEMLTEYEKQLDQIMDDFTSNKINDKELYGWLNRMKNVWNYSRIDIKNRGSESNSIRFFERDIKYDADLHMEYPDWFTDDNGVGVKIEYLGRNKHLHFQCINDGNLEIAVRSFDYRNFKGERKPILINCLKLLVNSKKCITEDMLISHDEPFIFSKICHNLERINIVIETKTIYYYYPELINYFTDSNTDSLKKDFRNIKEYIISEKSSVSENTPVIQTIEKESESEKTNIAIFGSCVSVDPFRTCYNNYKKDFNKMYEHQRSTIISLMNPKISYSDDEIKYLINVHDKLFIDSDIRRDFDKALFNHLENIDYLVINMFHDVVWGVLSYEDTYITKSDYISETQFYKNNQDKLRSITVYENETEYMELWKENCDKFFKYLSENHPNLRVILQKMELREYYLKLDGTYGFRQDFHDQAQILNPHFKKLEQYIEDNYDVISIPFPSDTCLDEGNIWGLYFAHYSRSYYENVFNQIKIKVLEDKLRKINNISSIL